MYSFLLVLPFLLQTTRFALSPEPALHLPDIEVDSNRRETVDEETICVERGESDRHYLRPSGTAMVAWETNWQAGPDFNTGHIRGCAYGRLIISDDIGNRVEIPVEIYDGDPTHALDVIDRLSSALSSLRLEMGKLNCKCTAMAKNIRDNEITDRHKVNTDRGA